MSDVERIAAVIDQIKPILAGQPEDVQGAALADCLAMWLAGHHAPGKTDETRQIRAALLATHCMMVRQLVPINARIIGTTE